MTHIYEFAKPRIAEYITSVIMKGSILLVVCLLYFSLVRCDQAEIPLIGDDWTISDTEGRVSQKGVPAIVPGQVHLDL